MNNQTVMQQILHNRLKEWVAANEDNLLPLYEQDGGVQVDSVGDTEHLVFMLDDDETAFEAVFIRSEGSELYDTIYIYEYECAEVEWESWCSELIGFIDDSAAAKQTLAQKMDVRVFLEDNDSEEADSAYQI